MVAAYPQQSLPRRAPRSSSVILISGGLGQLGQELARAAALRRIPATALSRAQLDIANSSAVASALSYIQPAIVVNAAAYTKVDLAETNIEEARRVNRLAPQCLPVPALPRACP